MINKLTGKKIGVFEVLGDSKERRMPSGQVLWSVRCGLCKGIKLLTKQQMNDIDPVVVNEQTFKVHHFENL